MSDKDSRVFRVQSRQVNLTIGAALREWLPGTSWSEIRRLLATRHVTVSGNLCLDEGRRLKEHEVVKLLVHPAAIPPKQEDVRIRFLDAHLVVVEKPLECDAAASEERAWPHAASNCSRRSTNCFHVIKSGDGALSRGRAHRKTRQAGPKRLLVQDSTATPAGAVHRIDRNGGLSSRARSVGAAGYAPSRSQPRTGCIGRQRG